MQNFGHKQNNKNTGFSIPGGTRSIPTGAEMSSKIVAERSKRLVECGRVFDMGYFGESVLGTPLLYLQFGEGKRRVLLCAGQHANEHITSALLLKFSDQLAQAHNRNSCIGGVCASELFHNCTILIAPCCNPDGVDLVTGALDSGESYEQARRIARPYPDIPFPSGWKANINGVDLNLQYPAGWKTAHDIKAELGFSEPAPRDYPGELPLCEPESRALYSLTRDFDPELVLCFHSQGEVIYWKYSNREPEGSYELARRFECVSGYTAEETPAASGNAGYKDWFIERYNRPGYTIEVGRGENPLPYGQLAGIYRKVLPIITNALVPPRRS